MTTPHFQHHQNLLQSLYQHCHKQQPFNTEQASEVDLEFLASLRSLADTKQYSEDYSYQGQSLICRIVAHYPHITPAVSRDLFWYFGGDCLHFMADEEINLYQQVDELRYEDDSISYSEAKAKIFQLH